MIVQPVEVAGRQRRLAEDVVPVLDAAVGQVDALQVLVEQLEEGVDLVADVGEDTGGEQDQQAGNTETHDAHLQERGSEGHAPAPRIMLMHVIRAMHQSDRG